MNIARRVRVPQQWMYIDLPMVQHHRFGRKSHSWKISLRLRPVYGDTPRMSTSSIGAIAAVPVDPRAETHFDHSWETNSRPLLPSLSCGSAGSIPPKPGTRANPIALLEVLRETVKLKEAESCPMKLLCRPRRRGVHFMLTAVFIQMPDWRCRPILVV